MASLEVCMQHATDPFQQLFVSLSVAKGLHQESSYIFYAHIIGIDIAGALSYSNL